MNEQITITELLNELRGLFGNERDKGTAFEKLIKMFLESEPKYMQTLSNVWMWKDFPYRDNIGDIGIDLVAKTFTNDYWAIQCKFYDEEHTITKDDVDTFLAASSKTFDVDGITKKFSYRLIASTTDKYNKNAELELRGQDPQVGRLGIADLLDSQIDWKKYSLMSKKMETIDKKNPRKHQIDAISDVLKGFEKYDRGKLIMACGTGKTFTSLRIAEEQLKGKGNVLFLVPSIALASQSLTEWAAQSRYNFDAAVVCSDNKASKGENSIELGFPSTTDVNRLKEWFNIIKNNNRPMNYIFSTYQSIDVVSQFQKETNCIFDLIICDEAHRTTGVTLSDEDESSFVKVHDNDFIKAKKRLYMTATPRIYADTAKMKVDEANATLCSMDDESIYGPEFHKLTFGESVKQGLLTDYKVLVLAVDEEYVKKELQDLLVDENHELKLEDSVKIMGCWNGLSKISLFDDQYSFSTDPLPMKRAVSFCNTIADSKKIVEMFNVIQEHVKGNKYSPETDKLVNISIKHVDGTFNALEKKDCINWLKDDIDDKKCRILTNARCLSEGVDVPALDAVMFLNPRSSMVDIIQSVGRVMRKAEGKKYGYVILPIGVSANENPEDALDNNEKYKMVWQVLQALRAHDDRFNNTINKIELNKKKPDQIEVIGIGTFKKENSDKGVKTKKVIDTGEIRKRVQLELDLKNFDKWKENIYSKMVKKVGSRVYWETWAKDIAEIAQTHIGRIKLILNRNDDKINKYFEEFLIGLRLNLNNSIEKEDAIEMLSQHIITKPVFDALFEGYEFVNNNPVSQAMQKMMDVIDEKIPDDEREKLSKFYNSVKERASGIDNAEGKQKIILELYEKFFKTALPKEVEKLGIVYTPTECVDFIINSVEYLMNKEFGKSLSDHGVHIIDGFTGTGTFIVRLLQSGVIKKEDLLYKYTNEIHANEIVLLAYYIAAINIEEAFHELLNNESYIPFEGIVLTDTFQLYEDTGEHEWTKKINEKVLPQNSERAKKQKNIPITVCLGNPPYNNKQKDANGQAQNLHYPNLENRIANTYMKGTNSQNKNSLYDSYIKAFRWASDRINNSNGIIAFVTNNSWLDGNAFAGFRKSIKEEFSSIYVINLRGSIRGRTKEDVEKEGQNIFNIMTGVAICFLVKNKKSDENNIYYYSLDDYMNKNKKLDFLRNNILSNILYKNIIPDEYNDWINRRNTNFNNFILLGDKNTKSNKTVFKSIYSNGLKTQRDAWCYNSSLNKLKNNIENSISYYNEQIDRGKKSSDNSIINYQKFSWTSNTFRDLDKKCKYDFNDVEYRIVQYRPFFKQYVAFYKPLNERQYMIPKSFPNNNLKNEMICIHGISSKKRFSALITNYIPDLNLMDGGAQSFPIYYYEKDTDNLFSHNQEKFIKCNAINKSFLDRINSKYMVNFDYEDVFYYIYALFHSKEYINKFSINLKKSLPRIPLIDDLDIFKKLIDAGHKLANLHLNYESVKPYNKCNVIIYPNVNYKVTKMKYGKNKNKSVIEFNDKISITNIPLKAYEYVVNGKSAIEWVMERYAITTDSKSGIINDPNDWCKEVNDDKYIFNLLLRIINVSIQTVDIVNSLPKLDFED